MERKRDLKKGCKTERTDFRVIDTMNLNRRSTELCQEMPAVRIGTYLARTTVQTELIEIQNIPCTVCQDCGHEQIRQLFKKKIDKLIERAAKGKLKTRVVVM
jgi:YgiT-type zinc finger domain-containing protein